MKHTGASIAAASAIFPALEPASPPEAAPVGLGMRLRGAPKVVVEGQAAGRWSGAIRSTTISFGDIHEHGELLVSYLKARRAIFIDRLHWNVAQADGMEFDQYDNPFCRWIVLHEFGEVIGGVRLLPTTARCGIYSYMLRDAQQGILPEIPTDALFSKAPVDPHVWEASRFFISEDVAAARRSTVQRMLFERMSQTARQNGATHILGIVPAVWSRWARRLGADATPIGTKFSIDGTWSQSVLFCVSAFLGEAGD